jgi:hypothetical protein
MSAPLRRLCSAIAALLFVSNGAAARPLAVTDVNVVQVAEGRILRSVTVVIDRDQIVAVGRKAVLPQGARRINGRDRYLMPGLWDMHVHHQGSGVVSLPLFVMNGVIGTRDMGSDLDFILPLRDQIAKGEVLGPRVVAAGPILDAAPASWPWRRRVSNATEATAAVAALKAAGVDFIKVHDSTPRDAYFAIAAEARRQELAFAGHVPNTVTVEEAATAGQSSIEHLANFRVVTDCSGGATYDPARCKAVFQLLARNRVWQTPTLAFYLNLPELLSGRPPPYSEFASPSLRRLWRDNAEASALTDQARTALRAFGKAALEAIPDMRANGVAFLAGCDGLVPGFCLHDELEWMTRAGMSPAEALRTATVEPAAFLGRTDHQGAVSPGQRADLVLLTANPLDDIRNARRIEAVVLAGRLLTRRDLDRLAARAKVEMKAEPGQIE